VNFALLSMLAALALGVLARMASGGLPFPDPAKRAAGYAALAAAALSLLARQVALAASFGAVGAALLIQAGARPRGRARRPAGAGSRVRSDWLEMRLDHETGSMDGTVRRGGFEGRSLSEMSLEELLSLAAEIPAEESDSLTLLRAYLDRAHPGWEAEPGQAPAAEAGAMGRAEALELLGLDEGATRAEIVAAHRRIAKRVHPDAGGSAALAAQINAAKDRLLRDL
jgi:hypothetical protein